MRSRRKPASLVLAAVCWLGLAAATPVHAFSTVVIDAGHGGHDVGQKVNGVYEKWLCLDVAIRLEKYLRAKGVKTVMTRRGDYFLPLPERVQVANKYADKSIFVSIHFNGARNSGAQGVESFYYSRNSFDLATRVHRRIAPAIHTENRGVKFARYHVIKNASQPAVLVEGGFLTNAAERRRCLTGSYRQALAASIGQGILDYKAARKSGTAR